MNGHEVSDNYVLNNVVNLNLLMQNAALVKQTTALEKSMHYIANRVHAGPSAPHPPTSSKTNLIQT